MIIQQIKFLRKELNCPKCGQIVNGTPCNHILFIHMSLLKDTFIYNNWCFEDFMCSYSELYEAYYNSREGCTIKNLDLKILTLLECKEIEIFFSQERSLTNLAIENTTIIGIARKTETQQLIFDEKRLEIKTIDNRCDYCIVTNKPICIHN